MSEAASGENWQTQENRKKRFNHTKGTPGKANGEVKGNALGSESVTGNPKPYQKKNHSQPPRNNTNTPLPNTSTKIVNGVVVKVQKNFGSVHPSYKPPQEKCQIDPNPVKETNKNPNPTETKSDISPQIQPRPQNQQPNRNPRGPTNGEAPFSKTATRGQATWNRNHQNHPEGITSGNPFNPFRQENGRFHQGNVSLLGEPPSQIRFNPFRQPTPRPMTGVANFNNRNPNQHPFRRPPNHFQSYQAPREQFNPNKFQNQQNHGDLPVPRPPYDPNHRIRDEEFEALFNIKRTFRKESDWVLPHVSKAYSSEPYEFENFQNQKEAINRVKDEILENYPYEKWRVIQSKFSLAPAVVRVLKKNLKLGHVVRNWPKAYEIFSSYPVVASGKLNSIHIGDQHGGMIIALNHYLHSHFEDIQWEWKATCDNPYYEDGPTADR